MRWPFRRKAAEQTADAPVVRDRPQESVAPPVDEASVTRAPARQWATLPAISTVVPLAAPLVVGPAPVVPLLRLDDRHGTARVDVPAGTVTGLARPVVRAPEPVARHADVPPPPIARRAAKPVPTEVTSLVDAVDEYVGEPREPAEPYRAPGWLRFMPDWAKAGPSPAIPGLPAPTPAEPELVIAEPPSFLPPELRNPPKAEPPKAELPPRMAEGVQPAAETLVPPARKRRPNLGQSRRLGLGAPISKPDLVHPEEPPPIVDGTVHTPQEPPPPSAAPAHVAAEPAPEPAPEPEPAPVREPEPAPVREPVTVDRETQDRETPSRETQNRETRAGELIHPTRGPSAAEAPSVSGREDPGPGSPGRTAPEAGRTPPSGSRPSVPAKPVPATYRATAELRPAPRRKELPRATVVDRVPVALANEVRTRQQADVSEVPVYRGPKVGEAAKARGARAFAAGGAVFLPDEAGPVDSPRTRGLLAHELVHAVQQRTLGVLPGPESPLGQRLEAEAQAAERFYSGEAGAAEPPPLIHAPRPAPAAAGEPDLSMAAQLATELLPAQTQTPAPTPSQPLHSPFDAVTTAEVDKIATESAKHVVQEWTNPSLQQRQRTGNTATTHPTAGGSRPGRTGGTFNAAARREELIAQTLTMRNAAIAPGEGALTELSDEDLITIDNIVASEAGQHGGTPPAGPAAQHYEPNSGKAWMHALTGMNMNYGLGLSGYSEKVGSDNSWFASETEDKRPLRERMADQLGVINENTATQFDTDTWWQDTDNTAASNTDQNAQHDESMYGRPNPDRSAVDINRIDLDELATRLYDRLRSRLRTELLIDRERAGLLTDFR